MKLYNVYEKRGDGSKSFINSVFAVSEENAERIALDLYGSPIEVEQA